MFELVQIWGVQDYQLLCICNSLRAQCNLGTWDESRTSRKNVLSIRYRKHHVL